MILCPLLFKTWGNMSLRPLHPATPMDIAHNFVDLSNAKQRTGTNLHIQTNSSTNMQRTAISSRPMKTIHVVFDLLPKYWYD